MYEFTHTEIQTDRRMDGHTKTTEVHWQVNETRGLQINSRLISLIIAVGKYKMMLSVSLSFCCVMA